MRKVIVFIACSIDGYIAREDGNLDWLGMVEQAGEDYGYGALLDRIDTVVMGRKTYEIVLGLVDEFPHKDKACYIITRSMREQIGSIIFYNDEPSGLIEKLKQESGKDIFVDGGAEIIHELLKADLIDEFIISTIPIMLGQGITLFKSGFRSTIFELAESRSYDSGLVQSYYKRVKGS